MPYRLSATLSGHSQDVCKMKFREETSLIDTSSLQVRAVASPTTDLVLSASRDATAIAWLKGQPDSQFSISAIYKPSQGFINSIAYAPPSPEAPQGEGSDPQTAIV
jgi:phospholipase A-2-activating protein